MDGAECMSRYNEHPCEQGNEMENHEAPELCVTPESLSHVGEAVGGGPAVATLPGTPELRRVLQVKRQLSYLTAREAETRAKIEREKREAEEEMERLRVAMAAVQTRMEERVKALESMAIEQEIKRVREELDNVVNSPLEDGQNPFDWLPDELIVPILLMLPVGMLCAGVPSRVCRRWHQLARDPRIRRRVKQGKWEAYASGDIVPRSLDVSKQFGAINALAVSSSGRWVFSGSSDDKISVWSGANGALERTLTGHTGAVLSLAVGTPTHSFPSSADDATTDGALLQGSGRYDALLYSGSGDKTVRVWCTRSWTTVRVLRGHSEAVKSLTVGPNGTLYSGGYDNLICEWDPLDGTLVRTLEGHSGPVFSLTVGGVDGSVLFSGSFDCTIRMWSTVDGTLLQTLTGHTAPVVALAVGVNGMLFSGSTDSTVRAWAAPSGRVGEEEVGEWTCMRTMRGHSKPVASLSVGKGGVLMSGGWDHTIQLWSKSGEHNHSLKAHRGTVVALATGPSGETYSACANGALLQW